MSQMGVQRPHLAAHQDLQNVTFLEDTSAQCLIQGSSFLKDCGDSL